MLIFECYRPTEIALEKIPDVLQLQKESNTPILDLNRKKPSAQQLFKSDETYNAVDQETNDYFDHNNQYSS